MVQLPRIHEFASRSLVEYPGKFRLHIKNDTNEVLLLTDGATAWMYFSKTRASDLVATGQTQADKMPNERLYFLHLLVLRYRDMSRFNSSFALEKEAHVKVGNQKMDYYVLKMTTKDPPCMSFGLIRTGSSCGGAKILALRSRKGLLYRKRGRSIRDQQTWASRWATVSSRSRHRTTPGKSRPEDQVNLVHVRLKR